MAASPRNETVVGCAKESFHDLSMTVEGEGARRARSGAKLELELDDGATVHLDLSAADCVASFEATGTFGELLTRGIAQPFLDRAPGDHVTVKIEGLRVERGERIAAYGHVSYRAGGEGASYREAGAPRPENVRVELLADGEEAAVRLAKAARMAQKASRNGAKPRVEEKRKENAKRGDRRVSLGFPLVVLGAAVAAALAGGALALSGPLSAAIGCAALAAHLGGIALFHARRRRFLPDLRTDEEERSGTGMRTALGMGVSVPLMMTTFFAVILAGISAEHVRATHALGGLVAASTLYLLVTLAVREWRPASRLARTLGAPAAKTAGQWGAVDGEVMRGAYARKRAHLLERASSVDSEGRTRTTVWWEWTDTRTGNALSVRLEDGSVVDVALAGGAVAAEVTFQDGTTLAERIAAGDRVRVVGRLEGGDGSWRVRSTGKDSLFVLGARRRPARAAAARALLLHRLSLAALAAIVAGGAALAALGSLSR